MIIAGKQFTNAGPVIRGADIHRVGRGIQGRPRAVVLPIQERRDHVVAVGGDQESCNGHPKTPGQQTCRQISEVATGDADGRRIGSTEFLLIESDSTDVITDLRQEPGNIDTVGGGQPVTATESGIGKTPLRQSLTVIKGSGNFQPGDVSSQGGEELFLQRGNPPLRIQDHHADPVETVKGVCYRSSRIAGGGRDDRQRL